MGSYKCCQPESGEAKQLSSLAPLLKLVTEENRLRLLCILSHGEHCVCEFENHLNLSQSLISHHLKDLKDNQMVTSDRRGQWVYYRLTPKGEDIVQALLNIK